VGRRIARMTMVMGQTMATFSCVCLLICSCCVMTAAWYLHLKYKDWPMWKAIVLSWLLAFVEYMLQVPANRIGHTEAKLSAATLRSIAELAILTSFIIFQVVVLHEPLKMNHVVGFGMVLGGVCVVVGGPWNSIVYSPETADYHSKIEGGSKLSSTDDLPFRSSTDNLP